jgi:dienelactone hydrolase
MMRFRHGPGMGSLRNLVTGRLWPFAATAGLFVCLLAGCAGNVPARSSRADAARCPGSKAAGGAPAPDPSTSSAVTGLTLRLVDRSRPTPATPDRAALSCRVLPTEVRFPARTTGPLPLVVVAHGRDGSPSSIAPLLDAWAAAGYVVAAPTFPTTRKDRDGRPLPVEPAQQAADMSFVIDQLLGRSGSNRAGPLHGLVDPQQIGAAGMSLGGLSVYGLVSNTCCRDRRVRAAILMAAPRREFPDDKYEENEAPVLLVQGDADPGYHNSRNAYPELEAPKWFITLRGSGHSPPFEVPTGPEAPFVISVTTRFWDRYLKDDRAAAAAIAASVKATKGQATLRRDLSR